MLPSSTINPQDPMDLGQARLGEEHTPSSSLPQPKDTADTVTSELQKGYKVKKCALKMD